MTAGSASPPTERSADRQAPGVLPEPQVRDMFDRIARVYDRMNAVMTAGLHQTWRRRAAELAALQPGDHALDLATGTGDLAFELGHWVAPDGLVVGADFSENMLAIAREKAAAMARVTTAPAGVQLRFEQANAMDLPYETGSFAAATVAFGARNFSDLGRGLAEMTRVVRPGGRLVVLEITTPTEGPLAAALGLWFGRLVPAIGKLAGDSAAYTYLPDSVRRFPPPDQLAAMMWQAGLRDVHYHLTAGGIIALHVGTVAEPAVVPEPAAVPVPEPEPEPEPTDG
jgi:demethylmenaquinone methyltransferase/2-methoxy-6-polyprenyl-1,4-benzoquinol methylase